jgi:ABC-type polysaccharide/polyol phosphate export permease
MSIWGALAGGFVGTLVLTTILRAASELQLTRIDLPFLLGTALTADRMRAKAIGYGLHFVAGLVFAVIYYLLFVALGHSGWGWGAGFGFAHALFAGTALVNVMLPLVHPRMGSPLTAAPATASLEAPGFLLLNYGVQTPVVTVIAHVAYGALVGGFTSVAG